MDQYILVISWLAAATPDHSTAHTPPLFLTYMFLLNPGGAIVPAQSSYCFKCQNLYDGLCNIWCLCVCVSILYTGCKYAGTDYLNGQEFPDPADHCSHCVCMNGHVTCSQKPCYNPGCSHPATMPGHCCPVCDGKRFTTWYFPRLWKWASFQ